jgi:hypothetical protein
MEEKYCMSVGTQLNIFYAQKLFVWLNYVKSPSTKEKWQHILCSRSYCATMNI